MMIALSILFWLSILLLGHTYAVYPKLLAILGRGKSLSTDVFTTDEELPEVAVLLAVYNEESVLEATLLSILASDYPSDKLRIYVGSDGSTDTSDLIVEQIARDVEGLSLRVFGGRNGKIRIINQLALDASVDRPDLLVLCDANIRWGRDALRKMAGHFKRDDVGLVCAAIEDEARSHSGIGDEEEAYVSQENQTKYLEGLLWGNVMGAFGACYTIRANAFSPVPENFIVDDFYQTMRVIESGSKAIVELNAICYESVSTEISEEFRRKRRIATGNFQNLVSFSKLFTPRPGNLANAFAFWSHKGLRWIGPILLLVAFVSSVVLAFLSPIYWVPVLGFVGTGFASAFDWYQAQRHDEKPIKLFRLIRYFYAMNAAIFCGMISFLRGGANSVWEPTKRIAPATATPQPEPAAKS